MPVTIVYPFPLNGIIPGGQITVERAQRDTPFPAPQPGEVNVPMSPQTYAMWRNVPNLNYPIGGGAASTTFQQTGILAAGGDTINFLPNAGALSMDNESVLLILPQGAQPQTEYTIDRGGLPNQIVLNNAVLDDTNYCVMTFVATI